MYTVESSDNDHKFLTMPLFQPEKRVTAMKHISLPGEPGNQLKPVELGQQEKEILSLAAMKTINGIIILDAAHRITWVNEGFTKLNGYTASEVIGKDPALLFAGSKTDSRQIEQCIAACHEGQPFSCEILVFTKYGQEKWMHINLQPVHDKAGKITHFFVVQTDITERHRLEEEQLRNKLNLQKEINRVMIKTQEKERNDLGRELHDNVNQILAAVKLQLEYGIENYAEEKETIKRCMNNIVEVIGEIRKLSHRLVLPRFSQSSLHIELQKLADNFCHHVPVQLVTDKLDESNIADDIRETLYRIAQEQLSNIIKHAQANKVTITLQNDDKIVYLHIQDDGVGFNVKHPRNGVGITNILNRAEAYSGAAIIHSTPGKGCLLEVSIPLKNEE